MFAYNVQQVVKRYNTAYTYEHRHVREIEDDS